MANIPPLKTIDDLNIFTRSGTVVDVQKGVRINTTTTTSGGSASAPSTTVRHTSEEVMTVFIREANGSELSAEFTDSCVPVRVGNRITVAYAGNKSVNRGYAAALVNHDTGKQGVIAEVGGWLVHSPSGGEGCGLFLLVLVLGPVAGFLLTVLLSPILGGGGEDAVFAKLMLVCFIATIAAFFAVFRPYWRRRRVAYALKTAIVQRIREEARRLGNA